MINGWHTELDITDYYGDSVVDVQTRLGDGRPGVQFPVGARYSTRLENVETGSVYCSMCSFQGIKRPGRKIYHSSPSGAEVKNGCCYTSSFLSSFNPTTLCEFWLAQLFLSIVSSPASFVSNWSPLSSSNHSSHRLPILLLAFPSVLLHTVSICIRS